MTLPWKAEGKIPKYIIVNENMEIVDTADTEDDGAKKTMVRAFAHNENVELYEATGFRGWAERIRTDKENREKASRDKK